MPRKPVEGKSHSIYLDFEAEDYLKKLIQEGQYKNLSAAVCAMIHRVMRRKNP
jgi:hypothetical protein